GGTTPVAGSRGDACDHGEPRGEAGIQRLDVRVRADRGHGALREVEHTRSAVDEDDPLRGQRVDGAQPEPEQPELRELGHVPVKRGARFSWKAAIPSW